LAEVGGWLYQAEGSVVERLGRARGVLQSLCKLDPSLGPRLQVLEGLLSGVEDLARDLEREAATLEADPARLEEVEERLGALRTLMRAHGPTLQEVLSKREGLSRELLDLGALGERLKEAEAAHRSAQAGALARARELSRKRSQAAGTLAERLRQELVPLAMPHARIGVEVRPLPEAALQVHGLDQVAFLFSANPGEELRPLSKVASGGELSRVLLALKVVLAGVDPVATYVFDEVDSGVGGAVAEIIGQKLAQVSRAHQVLCITHLPQIAACANLHLSVRKRVEKGRTLSEVVLLKGEERVEEIARMTGGRKVTEKARSHAREMLQRGGLAPGGIKL
jgi:DNA repair protein RecN (Recombination protein N)